MPKATLSFMLPQEAPEHLMSLHGPTAFAALSEIRVAMRAMLKHEESAEKTFDIISSTLLTTQHETGVEI